MKKYITKDMLVPVGAFGFMLVWGVISLINSYDVKISFYGFDGRGEGLLAIIFYFCFFITALTIKGKKSVSLVMDAVAAVGTINALWGIMQIFGAVPTNYGSVVATVPWDSTDKINAASGLSQSPLFLAMVLGISLVTVLSGAVLCEKKARRVVYAVSGCIMSFVLIFTYSVAGWIAFGIAVVTSLILVFTKKVPKKRLISIACAVLSSALAIQLICFGVGNIYDKYKLHDALDVDDVVGLEVLGSEPVNSGLAFLGHVGDDGSDIQALVSVDGAVEEDDLDTGSLCVLQDGIPAGGAGSGDQQIVDLVLNELLGGSDLLVVLEAVGEGSVIAVFLGEHRLEVLVVGGAVAGLVGVVVDDADLDEFAIGSGRCVGSGVCGGIGRSRVGGLLRTGAERGNHGDCQKQSKNLFHDLFPHFQIVLVFHRSYRCSPVMALFKRVERQKSI